MTTPPSQASLKCCEHLQRKRSHRGLGRCCVERDGGLGPLVGAEQ